MDRELTSWKDIAAYLQVTVRTAQKWEAERDLPVHRLPGPRGRVFAYEGELARWKNQSTETAEPAPEFEPAIPAGERSRPYMPMTAVVLCVMAAISALVVTAHLRTPSEMTRFDIRQHRFVTQDSEGRVLWEKDLGQPIQPAGIAPGSRTIVQFADVDRDNSTEVLFAPALELPAPSELFCYDENGQERWRYSFTEGFTDNGRKYSPPFLIRAVKVIDLPTGRETVVIANHHEFSPTRVVSLANDGRILWEYWHPGHLSNVALGDLDSDGRPELYLGGINNRESAATLVVLDPLQLKQTGGGGKKMVSREYSPAGEVARVLFPRSKFNRTHFLYNKISYLRVLGDRILCAACEDFEEDRCATVDYVFDSALSLQSVSASDGFLILLRKNAGGAPPLRLWEQEIAALGSPVVLRPRAGALPEKGHVPTY